MNIKDNIKGFFLEHCLEWRKERETFKLLAISSCFHIIELHADKNDNFKLYNIGCEKFHAMFNLKIIKEPCNLDKGCNL